MDDFQVFDFHRIFLGETPASFLIEIVFRTVVMYSYTILLLRLLGKRGMGQLSTLELAIIISFGSAIGDPMMGVDIPIFHGMVVVTTVAILQVGMERVINRHKKVELVMEGRASCLVDNGLIQLACLKENNMSHEDLMRSLRSSQVEQLGLINKAFFETSGNISVIFLPKSKFKPGLTTLPVEFIAEEDIIDAKSKLRKEGYYSCLRCAYTDLFKQGMKIGICPRCHHDKWVGAIIS
jgi:uncharacterized membrane protein YcaP (DUF421 family)